MSHPDVVIIGAGLVGAACARELASRDVAVHLIDAGPEPGMASTAAAGMLAPLVETSPEAELLSLSVRGRDLYHQLAPALKEETGIDVGLWTDGILQLAMDDDEAEDLRDAIAWQRQMGFKSDWLSADDLRATYPGLGSDTVGGKLAPEDGAIEPVALLKALLTSATRQDAAIHRGLRVTEIVIDDDRVVAVRTDQQTVRTENVVVAAGAWSGRLGGLPRPLTVEPIRGQMLAMPWPADEPPAIVYGRGGYVVHRGGEALAGSTMEHVGFDAGVTDAGVAAIVDAVVKIYPALADASPSRTWSGLRPVTPDGRPLIGRDPVVAGLWYATGHGRNGVLLAGVTAELIGRLVTDEPVERDLSGVDPGRFWRW